MNRYETIGVLASGNGSNLQAVIDAVNAGRIRSKISCVISDKERAHALGRARQNGIKAIFVDSRNSSSVSTTRADHDMEIARILKEHGVTVVILAGYMKIVTKHLIDQFKQRILNIHPALLPSFPGMNGQKQAIDYGVRFSGCTVHFVTEGMDEGPIILQAVVKVENGWTADDLSGAILKEEHRILPEAIQLLEQGRLEIKGRTVNIL